MKGRCAWCDVPFIEFQETEVVEQRGGARRQLLLPLILILVVAAVNVVVVDAVCTILQSVLHDRPRLVVAGHLAIHAAQVRAQRQAGGVRLDGSFEDGDRFVVAVQTGVSVA